MILFYIFLVSALQSAIYKFDITLPDKKQKKKKKKFITLLDKNKTKKAMFNLI